VKPTIALFVYDPKCSVQCGNGMMAALGEYYNFRLFSKNEMEGNFFRDKDIVAFPGGIGDSESFHNLLKHNKQAVTDYVNDGGRYLGICMGAYWAGSHYFNILKDVDAVQYITRPGTDTRRPHAKDISIEWQGQPDKMFFYDGCAFTGTGNYDTIARYSNGDPMAIYQDRIGVIGCHPESEPFWYDGYSWLRGKYRNQHELLLDFVNDLTKR
jgi:glutamine amidotransferase-like uncharacterized protein